MLMTLSTPGRNFDAKNLRTFSVTYFPQSHKASRFVIVLVCVSKKGPFRRHYVRPRSIAGKSSHPFWAAKFRGLLCPACVGRTCVSVDAVVCAYTMCVRACGVLLPAVVFLHQA